MAELELKEVVKIYPFVDPKKYLFSRKRAKKALEEQQKKPYLSNEGVIAVQKFNLAVQSGDFVVLYGPSGCGKSTVLRMIAGLTDVTAGELTIDGEDMEGVMPEDRDVAMVFQEYSLYPHFTVAENIAFPLKNVHLPREEVDRKVDLMLRLLELTGVRNAKPDTLSGGEKQRTAIGRALIRRPKILLMDEPFSNLDAPLRMKLRVMIKKVHQEIGTTFVYVTHDMFEAMSLATRLVLMKDGMIVQQGTPKDLYRRPRNLTAGLMTGSPEMNVFRDALLLRDEKGCLVRLYGKEFPCPGLLPDNRCGEVILGVRPVHMELVLGPGDTSADSIPCKVLLRESVGTEVHFTLSTALPETDDCEIRVVVRAENAPADLISGREVQVRPKMEEALLFDSVTENRIG